MSKQIIKVSVCSPVNNEEDNIKDLVSLVNNAMSPIFDDSWEQILVDDGSTDRSASIIQSLMKEHPNLKLFSHNQNLGECAAWQTCFNNSQGELVVILAADLQNDPTDIPRLVDAVLKSGFDCGSGKRTKRKDNFFYWAATRVLNVFMCIVFGLRVRDVSSSFFAAKREYVTNLKLVENDHRYILAIFKRRGAMIKEIPTSHMPRKQGRSHYTRWKIIKAIPELSRFILRYYSGVYDYPLK